MLDRLLDWVESNYLRASLLLLVVLLFVVMFALSSVARAGTATVTWTLPTQNTDGSAIAAGTLASTTVAWGSCGTTAGTFGTEAGRASVAVPGTTYTVLNLAPATYCFHALVTTTGGVTSAWSAVASKAVPAPAPAPQPPTIVTVATVAYEITTHPLDGVRLGRAVGTVPLGTPCGAELITGSDYYEVAREAVTITKQPKSTLVVAKCG